MSDILDSSLVNQGIFRAESFIHSQTINPPATGNLVTIGTVGKLTKLTALSTGGNGKQLGISIEVDGVVLVGPSGLADLTPLLSRGFYVSQGSGTTSEVGHGCLQDVIGELITIKKNAGDTTQPIVYSYEVGVVK